MDGEVPWSPWLVKELPFDKPEDIILLGWNEKNLFKLLPKLLSASVTCFRRIFEFCSSPFLTDCTKLLDSSCASLNDTVINK